MHTDSKELRTDVREVLSDWKSVGNRLEDFQCAMGHLSIFRRTFVPKMRDICPKNAGHLSGHSSLEIEIEIEYRVRDREREKHPPVPPLKGGLRCAKKIDIF